MKIDFYISSLSGGGAEKVLVTLAKALAYEKNDVSIISLEKRPQFYSVSDNVKLLKINNNSSKICAIKDYLDIRNNMKNRKSDISISFLNRCNLLVLAAGLFTKRKIVVCDRNNPLREHSKFIFWFSNLMYQRANRVIVQTNQIKSFYWKNLQKKISVIENPIDTEVLSSQLDGNETRKKVIISMGRLESQKDFKTIINAFSLIANLFPEWCINIFGKGDMKEELQELINNKEMSNRIFLKGRTEKPFKEMTESSIFVLSSNYEGFPNVLCEAMQAGCLCIASDCISGPRELIIPGTNGWLFDVGDEKMLASLLYDVINNEDKYDSMRGCSKKAVERLELSKNLTEWVKMICDIVGE